MSVCLSGGAKGADLAWGIAAEMAGHDVVHFVFEGHRSKARHAVVLSEDELRSADPFLKRANATLRRRWPVANPFVANLLRRNWYQVRDADAVYAVSSIGDDGLVSGGTAWAVQMFLDRFAATPCPAYVYDQAAAQWYAWRSAWEPIESPPPPEGRWAGIGSRDLKTTGLEAITQVFG